MANIFSCRPTLNAASTAGETVNFAFVPRTLLRIENLGTVDLFVDFGNQTASTCKGTPILKSCSEHRVLEVRDLRVPFAGIGLHTTSTGAGGQLASVLAIE